MDYFRPMETDIYISGKRFCKITLRLSEKVLAQKRSCKTLLEV